MENEIKILLTGFEPFGEFRENPTEKIVRKLAETGSNVAGLDEGSGLHTRVLPVSFRASEIVNSLLPEGYDFVVHLGLHAGIEDFAIERVAINLDDYRIPDNEGVVVRDRPIDPEGKNAYFVTLPVHEIEAALKWKEIPCHLSYSAGTFLCNHLLYTTLNFIEKSGLSTRAGFIHVPSAEKMRFEVMLEGIRTVLRVLGREKG